MLKSNQQTEGNLHETWARVWEPMGEQTDLETMLSSAAGVGILV